MGENITFDMRTTLFVDLDGTVVKHNYDPDNIPDVFLPSSIEYLKKFDGYIVVTTGRKWEHCIELMLELHKMGIKIEKVLHDLPAGKRILINDYRNILKAEAINVIRDTGINP